MSTVTMEDKEAYCPICYFFGDVCTPSEEDYDLPCPAFQLDMGKADDMPDEGILYISQVENSQNRGILSRKIGILS